jgi:hypothetical protein
MRVLKKELYSFADLKIIVNFIWRMNNIILFMKSTYLHHSNMGQLHVPKDKASSTERRNNAIHTTPGLLPIVFT